MTFQNNERKFYQQLGDHERSHINNWIRERQKDFRAKYGNRKIIIKKKPDG